MVTHLLADVIKRLGLVFGLLFVFASVASARDRSSGSGDINIGGDDRSNGTHVEPYMRSHPDALEQAARDYRIQVYDTFHSDRPEFDRRRAEWRQLEQSWEAAAKPDRDVPALLDWLAEATVQSQSDSIGDLPEAPKI